MDNKEFNERRHNRKKQECRFRLGIQQLWNYPIINLLWILFAGGVVLMVITEKGNPIRLYSLDEITEIFCKLGLRICNSFADFSGKPSSDNDIQLMVYYIRE